MNETAKGLPAVLREWAGSYEEGSFDTEAGLMIEAAEAIENMLAALKAARGVVEAAGDFEPTPLLARIDAAIARAESTLPADRKEPQ